MPTQRQNAHSAVRTLHGGAARTCRDDRGDARAHHCARTSRSSSPSTRSSRHAVVAGAAAGLALFQLRVTGLGRRCSVVAPPVFCT